MHCDVLVDGGDAFGDDLGRVFGHGPATTSRDMRTLIEAMPEGWWYSAVLPNDRLVAVYMTDAETLVERKSTVYEFFVNRLRGAPHTRERFGRSVSNAQVQPFAASTYRNTEVWGRNRLLIGDAADTFDPLSSLGICKALESGLRGGRAIAAHLAGDRAAFDEYGTWSERRFARYLDARLKYYSHETRWPTSNFWRRRQELVA